MANDNKRVEVNIYYWPNKGQAAITSQAPTICAKFTPYVATTKKAMKVEKILKAKNYKDTKQIHDYYYYPLHKNTTSGADLVNVLNDLKQLFGVKSKKFFPYKKIMKVRAARHLYEKLISNGFYAPQTTTAISNIMSISGTLDPNTISITALNIPQPIVFNISNDQGQDVFTVDNTGNFTIGSFTSDKMDELLTKSDAETLFNDMIEKKMEEYLKKKGEQ